MQLYQGLATEFVKDAVQHELASKLQVSFLQLMGYKAPEREVVSWRNSLQDLALQLTMGHLLDTGVILEWHLPYTSGRIDCVLMGRSRLELDSSVVIELKQWQQVFDSEVEGCVETILAGSRVRTPHPSVQVRGYKEYLQDHYPVFYDASDRIDLSACSYLHNMPTAVGTPLLRDRFSEILREYPLFDAGQTQQFRAFLQNHAGFGDGERVLDRVLGSKIRPNPKLMQHTAEVIKGNRVFALIDDQIVAYNTILTYAKKGVRNRKKTVIVISGGPGTGKSVIALNVLAELSRLNIPAQHATGSRAFTENLRKAVGRRAAMQFKYFNGYKDSAKDELDVLILDEAHRIRETSNDRFTPRSARRNIPQVQEIIDAARVSVFFIDDQQRVRPDEIGNSALIKDAAKRTKAKFVRENLHTQFRCAGSQEYMTWVDDLFGARPAGTAVSTDFGEFDLQFFPSPIDLEAAIHNRVQEGYTARMTAGFCWPWSNARPDGSLINDVQIGDYARPWNAKPESRKFAPDVPPSNYWATDPRGINQIGCIYTAQGFEFDYVGVVFGRDLVYRQAEGWVGQSGFSYDNFVKRRAKQDFVSYVQHVYRVLMTRGMRGCYLFFVDSDTASYVARHASRG